MSLEAPAPAQTQAQSHSSDMFGGLSVGTAPASATAGQPAQNGSSAGAADLFGGLSLDGGAPSQSQHAAQETDLLGALAGGGQPPATASSGTRLALAECVPLHSIAFSVSSSRVPASLPARACGHGQVVARPTAPSLAVWRLGGHLQPAPLEVASR